MRSISLVALRPLTYRTRRLQAGDYFAPSEKLGRLLVAAKQARLAQQADSKLPKKLEWLKKGEFSIPASDGSSLIDALRAQATARGLSFDRRWGVKRMRELLAG